MLNTKRFIIFAVLALAALGATASAAEDDSSVTNVISTCTTINNFVDVGAPGLSPGDIYVFIDTLRTPDGLRTVGELTGWCNLINPAAVSFGCSIVASLDGGTITAQMLYTAVTGAVSVGAITGGTGRFQSARGEVQSELGAPCGPHKVTVKLRPATLKL